MATMMAAMMLLQGCASSVYVAHQFDDDGPKAWTPVGNALMGDFEILRDTWRYEDHVLPVWLDRSLNTICIVIDLPFSLVFDVITFPYQLIVYNTQDKDKTGANEP
jgi:uncharacterized protein YceK